MEDERMKIDAKELLMSIGANNAEQQRSIDALIADLIQARPEPS